MLEIILLAIAPLAVNAITQGVKKARTIQLSDNKKKTIRYIAVVLSFVTVLLGGFASGEIIDESIITTFVEVTAVFITSQITYFVVKKKVE